MVARRARSGWRVEVSVFEFAEAATERIWYILDSHGHILELTSGEFLKTLKLFPFGTEAGVV